MVERGLAPVVAAEGRLAWVDNLRTGMVFLVVALHAAGCYESSGGWALFWLVDDPATSRLADWLISIVDIFVMPTMFFVSGYVTPRSLATRGTVGFVLAKVRRLMVPWLIAVLTLVPLYKVIFLASRNIPQEYWTTYFHWNALWGQNWLWFLPVLFVFSVVYAVLSKLRLMPARVPLWLVAIGVFVVGWAFSVGMDLFGRRGWTHTLLLDFQNERLLVYFLVFVLGTVCFRQQAFGSRVASWRTLGVLTGGVCATVLLYCYLVGPALLGAKPLALSRGAYAALLWLSFHLSLYGMIALLTLGFQRFLNSAGPLGRLLNARSYAVYVIHTIVLGVIAMALLHVALPAAVKLLIATVGTFIACNLVVYAFRKTMRWALSSKRNEVRTMKAATTVLLVMAACVIGGCEKPENAEPAAVVPHVPIHLAALQGHVDAINEHIAAGSDLNQRDDYGSTALHVAATFGKTDVARALIDAGADLEARNNDGSTALHVAAFFCRTEIVRMLLEHGADRNSVDDAGRGVLEKVAGPFEHVKVVYDQLGQALKPLGLRLDYDRLRKTRPQIAEMLQES